MREEGLTVIATGDDMVESPDVVNSRFTAHALLDGSQGCNLAGPAPRGVDLQSCGSGTG